MAPFATADLAKSFSLTQLHNEMVHGQHRQLKKAGSNNAAGLYTHGQNMKEFRKTSSIESFLHAKDAIDMETMFTCGEESLEDLIYNLFRIPNKSDASIGKLIMVLKHYGLRETDPRLEPMMCKIREIEAEKEERVNEARDPKHWRLGRDDFKRVVSQSLSLVTKTLQNDLVIPCWAQFAENIKDIYLSLARFSSNLWGVSICTVDGQRLSFGDAKVPFCVQSISKAFNYSIAASELGADFVHQFVGQEPSGRLFNDICLDSNNKPHNPMVNSGAIIITSLIQRLMNLADRYDHMITKYRQISGGEYVGFNNAVFLSEHSTADRNFALSYFMKEKGCFPPETRSLKEALDFYFQLCSLEVDCESAAVMAATLANGGVCPITGERCLGSRPCRDVLTLMNSCGMYDYSGQFAFHVGLPAKSGVSGGMIVVIPNLMGIALWSPPLDKLGNTCRGVAFCKELIKRFNFHNYDSLSHDDDVKKFDPRRRDGEREKEHVVALLFAAKAGDLNTVRRLYLQGCNLEIQDYDKRTALHLAASEGQFEVALFLLEVAKVRPDPCDRWNRTPLDDAREANHISCALLLERRMPVCDENALQTNGLLQAKMLPVATKSAAQATQRKGSTFRPIRTGSLNNVDVYSAAKTQISPLARSQTVSSGRAPNALQQTSKNHDGDDELQMLPDVSTDTNGVANDTSGYLNSTHRGVPLDQLEQMTPGCLENFAGFFYDGFPENDASNNSQNHVVKTLDGKFAAESPNNSHCVGHAALKRSPSVVDSSPPDKQQHQNGNHLHNDHVVLEIHSKQLVDRRFRNLQQSDDAFRERTTSNGQRYWKEVSARLEVSPAGCSLEDESSSDEDDDIGGEDYGEDKFYLGGEEEDAEDFVCPEATTEDDFCVRKESGIDSAATLSEPEEQNKRNGSEV